MWSRVRSLSIVAPECVDRAAIALVRLLSQESSDTNDRGRAHASTVVNFTIAEVRSVEQPRDVPPLGQRSDLGRRAQVKQQAAHFPAIARCKESFAKLICKQVQVADRG